MNRSDPNTSASSHWETPQELAAVAADRMRQGFAPPVEIYQVQHRSRIDWADFPDWARPLDPELFDRCCHEG